MATAGITPPDIPPVVGSLWSTPWCRISPQMTLHNSLRKLSRIVLGVSLGTIVISANVGCRNERSTKRPRQFFPGMDDQPKYKPQAQSKFFADGRSMREPVTGTVPFGRQAAMAYGNSAEALSTSALTVTLDRQDLLRDDDRVYKGVNPDGSYLLTAPIRELEGLSAGDQLDSAVVSQLVLRGQEQFNIFCMVCHGKLGDGKGMVGVQWSYPLPNFHDPAYQPGEAKGQDGYLFHVIRNGVPNQPGAEPALRMPSYSGQINARDAWAIVLYFRALQESVKGSIDEVPTQEREKLLTNRPTAMVKPAMPTGEASANIQMTDLLVFEPALVTIQVGQIVEWKNASFVVHTVTADPAQALYQKDVHLPARANPFDSDRLLPDEIYRRAFNVPGRYRYFCKPHETTGMSGEIIVETAHG